MNNKELQAGTKDEQRTNVDIQQVSPTCPKPIVSRCFSEQEVYGIWQFADAQLQIIKGKKEASQNHVEMMCLSFTANCIVDIMDTIADMLEPVNCG